MDRLERQPVDVEAISAYLDGELSETERAAVEARLAADPTWRAELESLRWSVSLVGDTPDAPLPRSFELPLPSALPTMEDEAADSARRTWSWLYGALRASAGIAAVLLVLVVAADAYQSLRLARPAPAALSSVPAAAPRSAADTTQAPAPAAANTTGGVSAFGAAPTSAAKAAAAAPKAPSPVGTAPAPAPAAAAQAFQAPTTVASQSAAQSTKQPAATTTPAAKVAAAGAVAATPEVAARSAAPPAVQPPSAGETIPVMAVTPPPEPAPAFPWRAVEIALALLAAALIAAALLMRRQM